MNPQIHLSDELREKLKKPINLYIDVYAKRVLPIFSNIDEEAEKVAEKHFNSTTQYGDPYDYDMSDHAEQSMYVGLEHYEGMSLMRYNTKLMWISTLYQFWEQQVRKFLYEEGLFRAYQYQNGNDITFEGFCENGTNEIKAVLKQFGIEFNQLLSGPKIDELRVLANVIKHGDGKSAQELRKLRPGFFAPNGMSIDRLEIYKTTLNDESLIIQDQNFVEYCNAIIQFWDELPEFMCWK